MQQQATGTFRLMRSFAMPSVLALVLLCGTMPTMSAPPPAAATVGTLWNRETDWYPGGGQPYRPEEGDMIFFSSISCLFSVVFKIAGSGHPWHVGIIVRNSAGELCVLESGGYKMQVALVPVGDRLPEYLEKRKHRRIWVRRIKTPLTEAQSRCLTSFAEAQDGKRYAGYLRICMLGMPSRPLKPTEPNQSRWFCAELVCECLRVCGLCPACWMVPEKTTPQDLFNDKRDVRCGWWPPETWSPDCQPPPPGPLCAPR